MTVTNQSNAPHYKWAQICDGWRLLDGDDLSVIEENMPPGTREERHVHAKANQVFYVLEGVLTLEVDGTTHHLKRYDSLNVTPGQAHQARNDGETDPVRFVVISAPTTRGDRTAAPR